MEINAYAAHKPKDHLQPFNYKIDQLAPNEVAIDITHCGICHSDIHLIDNDWHMNCYPLVPGHEIVGIVHEKGSDVKHLEIGQRVGIGWQCDSCGQCEWCQQAEENLCAKEQATCVGHFGGFADKMVVSAHFAFPIPDALSSAEVAPLFCGGATVYLPLRQHLLQPKGQRVAILGIGGLGHLAIQFAHAMRCDVTALSGSANKENEARHFGADHFFDISQPTTIKTLKNSFDFILVTTPHGINWVDYLAMLRPQGKLCIVGAIESEITIPVISLVNGCKIICGSNIAGSQTIKEMLDFAAHHQIKAQVQAMPMQQVNDALDIVRKGQARYRIVLKNEHCPKAK